MNSANAVNVATKSTNGHFVKEAKQVVMISEKEESFNVFVGPSREAVLQSENHGDITIKEDCTVLHQDQYNPFSEIVLKRLD